MGNIYIAVNGDDVGSRIGDAIANDDHEGLAQASSSIQNAHDSIDQWVDSIGGKKVTSAGDDAIYLVPEQAVNDLDSIREDYKQQSGHGLTIGVGPSMSQASKALIYGKLNGKDQTIHYEPMMEDYLSEDEDDAAPEIPEETEVQGQADADMEQDAGAADLENAPPTEDVDDSGSAVPGAEAPQDPAAEAAPEDQMDAAAPPAGDENDMADDDQAMSESPDDAAAAPAEEGAVDGKTDKDFGTSEDDLSEDQGAAPAADGTDEDMPDTDSEDDAAAQDDGSMPPVPDEDDAAAPAAPGEEDASAMSADDDSEDGSEETLDQDDVAAPEDAGAEDQGEDPLASMIHGDMQSGGDDSEQDPDAEQGDDASLDDELRQDIAEALVAFKENKHMLEDARESAPELYNATLTMLRSMIAMAKKLGFAPEQDMADSEAAGQLEQEFPEAGAEDQGEEPAAEEPSEEESEDDSGEESEAPSDKKEAPPAKKQVGRLQRVQ